MLKELILKNRSYRRFYQEVPVDEGTLRELVDLARCSASASNRQPLKFMLSCDPPRNATIFSCLAWAGYLKDWPGPAVGEQPAAYIIILGDTRLAESFGCDQGIAAQSILLGATEKGLGGCIIGSVQKRRLSDLLAIPEHLQILLVIALGKPRETVVLEQVGPDGDIRYWRDAEGRHHVPKRSLEELLVV
jgi:nitroreductase